MTIIALVGVAVAASGCTGGSETTSNPSQDDRTAPVVAITAPTTASSYATGSATVSLGGSASDDTAVDSVTWANDRGGSGTAAGTDSWSVAAVALQSGGNRITVTALDAAGNSASDVIDVSYTPADTTPPTVSITMPTSAPDYTTGSGAVSLGGNAGDDTAVDSVSWVNDRGGSGTAAGTDSWSIASVALASGVNRITVTAFDAAGNNASDVIDVTYTPADTTSPNIAITSPASGGSYTTNSDSVVVSGTASDDVGVFRVSWSLNGGAASDATGTDSWSTPVIQLNQGDNTIAVVAFDGAGNQSAAQIVVTYDAAANNVLHGIGILGDSNSDEFRADDNRGGAYAAVTFNWVEQLVRNRGLNFGSWGTRASPRRSGYRFNWALSGATASSMLSGGQHTGLAQQVAAGDVTLVYIYIGFNDFAREKYAEIYDGTLSGGALDAKIAGVVDDITTAVAALQAAGSVDIVLAELWDYSVELPQIVQAFPDPAKRQSVTDAIGAVNAGLAAMAQQRGGIVLVDISAAAAGIYGQIDSNGFIDVGGELIDTVNPGNEPHHLNLDDGSHHGGTVANGLTANPFFIEPVNAAFGTAIAPFSDQDILETAGIAP